MGSLRGHATSKARAILRMAREATFGHFENLNRPEPHYFMKTILNFFRRICGGNGTYREEWRATFSGDGNTCVYRGVRPHMYFGRARLQAQVLDDDHWSDVHDTPGGFVTFVDAKQNKNADGISAGESTL